MRIYEEKEIAILVSFKDEINDLLIWATFIFHNSITDKTGIWFKDFASLVRFFLNAHRLFCFFFLPVALTALGTIFSFQVSSGRNLREIG